MKHISDLKNFGTGRDCVIIGGGTSLDDFDRDHGMYQISCNTHWHDSADMIIYYDLDVKEYYEKTVLNDKQILIGYKYMKSIHTCERCNYFYTYDDMVFGDTGFHAMQFADKLFNFSHIYLVGFDYYLKGGKYHHSGADNEQTKIDSFMKYTNEIIMNKYSVYKPVNKIYNCNIASRLEMFEKV